MAARNPLSATESSGAAAAFIQAAGVRMAKGFEIAGGRWALWISAAVFGGAVSVLCRAAFRNVPPTYPDFIVGQLATTGFGKAADYAMLLGFGLGAAGFFAVIAGMFSRLSERAGAPAMEEAYQRFILAVVPALAWLATLILPRGENFALFWGSAFLVAAASGGLWLVLGRSNAWRPEMLSHRTGAVLDGFTLVPIAAMLAIVAIAMAGNRIGILFGPQWFKHPATFYWMVFGGAALGIGATVTLAIRARGPDELTSSLCKLLLAIQILLPGLFLAVLPVPVVFEGRIFYGVPIPPGPWIALGIVSALAWGDLVRLWRKRSADPASVVSIFSLIAMLIYCRVAGGGLLGSLEDDYHVGEEFVPWWSWAKHGLLPLWDFTPPRGFINYKLGFLASLFTDQTAAGLKATVPYQFASIVLLVFFPLALVIGKWRAFFVLSFAALDDVLGDIDVLMTAGLCMLGYAWTRCAHVTWLMIWLAVGITAVLIAPGQGGLLVIATAPAGAWRVYHAVRHERMTLLQAAGVAAALLATLALATPLGLMVAGAVRYGAEQSAVNGVANGIPWVAGFGSFPNIHPWLFEIIRFGWVAVGAVAVIITLWVFVAPKHQRRNDIIFFGVAISLLCGLYVIRSAVRIDPGSVGRPGWATIWALALLLPILLTLFLRGTQQFNALAITVIAAASLTAQFGTTGIDASVGRPFAVHHGSPAPVDGAKIGMPNLGVVNMDSAHVERLVVVKRQLDRLLAPEETFLDMTNRSAQYFYFDRPPPVEVAAFYNLITTRQQLRAIEAMEKRRVPVALTSAYNQLGDGLTASARTPLLYRYLLLHFVPITLEGFDYMLRPERLDRIKMLAADPGNPSEEALQILDRDFLMADFGRTQSSWGKSADTLQDRMRQVVKLSGRDISSLNGVEQIDEDTYRVTGAEPAVTFDVGPAKIRGRDAGLLQFEFVCVGTRTKPVVTVAWAETDMPPDSRAVMRIANARDTIIAPLDAAPRWLLSRTLGSLRLSLAEPARCKTFTLKNIVLAQRKDVDAMDDMLRRNGSP